MNVLKSFFVAQTRGEENQQLTTKTVDQLVTHADLRVLAHLYIARPTPINVRGILEQVWVLIGKFFPTVMTPCTKPAVVPVLSRHRQATQS